MWFIILGLIFIVIGLFITRAFVQSRIGSSSLWSLIATIPITLWILGIIFGIMMPTGECKPMEEVKTVELKTMIGNHSIIYNYNMSTTKAGK